MIIDFFSFHTVTLAMKNKHSFTNFTKCIQGAHLFQVLNISIHLHCLHSFKRHNKISVSMMIAQVETTEPRMSLNTTIRPQDPSCSISSCVFDPWCSGKICLLRISVLFFSDISFIACSTTWRKGVAESKSHCH